MKKTFYSILAFTLFINFATAQDAEKAWKYKASLGADFAALLQINPKAGSGDDRLGFGGNALFSASYKKGRMEWNNSLGLLMSVQKIGSLSNWDLPFQKANDNWFLRSNFAYLLKDDSKFSYWFGTELTSQIAPTYKGNLLNDSTIAQSGPISSIFAPANFTAAPGIQWNPIPNLKIRVSPATLKMNIVADDSIASRSKGGFGTRWASATDYDKVAYQLGGFLNANYTQELIKFKTKDDKDAHRIVYTSNLNLYTNYLKDPQFIDVDWQNCLDFFIVNGLSISLLGNLWYDHDYNVILKKATATTSEEQGKGVSFTTQLLIKYTLNF
jgi:Protein of unknown function (DUF3078)